MYKQATSHQCIDIRPKGTELDPQTPHHDALSVRSLHQRPVTGEPPAARGNKLRAFIEK